MQKMNIPDLIRLADLFVGALGGGRLICIQWPAVISLLNRWFSQPKGLGSGGLCFSILKMLQQRYSIVMV